MECFSRKIGNLKKLGTVHFLRGRGGWWDLGGSRKKMALKGGHLKNKGKGGVT